MAAALMESSVTERRHRASYVIKVCGECNLACSYCYYFNSVFQRHRARMDMALIVRILEQVSQLSDRITLSWHGGEPLLMGVRCYEKIVEQQHLIERETGARFKNVIQTNGTLLDESWAKLFKEHGFRVGVSLDGPKWLHDANRCYKSGTGSFEDTCRGLRLLQHYDVPFGVLAVLTRYSLGHEDEIFDFFVDMGINRFDFLPCVELDLSISTPDRPVVSRCSLRPGELSDSMIRVFDIWMKRDDPSIGIRSLEQIVAGLLGGKPTLCTFRADCTDHITIENGGGVSPCGNLASAYPYGDTIYFGNVASHPLDDILTGESSKKFQKEFSLPEGCSGCIYLPVCGGGCSRYRYMWRGSWSDTYYFCHDRKRLFGHIVSSLNRNHPHLGEMAVRSLRTLVT